MKKSIILISVVLLIFLLGEVALFFSGLLPQEPILESIRASLDQLELENERPYVLHSRERNGIDNFTDCEILNLSYYLDTRTNPSGILTNPVFWRDDMVPVEELRIISDHPAANGTYSNYCMGYRIWMRPMLSVFNYMEIRSIGGFALLVLFGLSLITVIQITKSKLFSALYALCIVALNPLAISGSLTLMVCFIIAFIGILAMPAVIDLRRPDSFRLSLLFLTLGAVTQYFDFYTCPLITYAFPMIVFLSVQNESPSHRRVRYAFSMMICGFGAWLFAYIGIWGLKLAATALFTNVDVWGTARNALDASLGVVSDVGLFETLRICAKNILSPEVVGSLAISAVVWIVLVCKNPDRLARLLESLVFVVIGMISIVWIALAKRTYEHSFFQYRTLGVLLMGVFAFMAKTTQRKIDQSNLHEP